MNGRRPFAGLVGLAIAAASMAVLTARQPPESTDVKALIDAGHFEHADRLLDASLRDADVRGDARAQAAAFLAMGRLRAAQNRLVDADAALEAASARYASVGAHESEARTWREIGDLAWRRGDGERTTTAYRRAADLFAAAGLVHDQAGALRSSIYGSGYANRSARRQVLLEALRLIAGHPDQTAAHRYVRGALLHDIGDQYYTLGRYGDAGRIYVVAETLLSRDPDNTRARSLLLTSQARLLRAQGDARGALEVYARVLDLQRRATYTQGIGQTLTAMATAQASVGQPDAAIRSLVAAVEAAARSGPDWRVPAVRLSLATARLEAGDRPGALREFRRYEAMPASAALGPGYRVGEVRLLEAAGRPEEALAVSSRLIDAMRASGGLQELRAHALLTRSRLYLARGDRTRAMADLADAQATWDGIRRHLPASDAVRRGFADLTASGFSSRVVDALAGSGQALAALEAAEWARTQALRDLLRARQHGAADLPDLLSHEGAPSLADVERRLLAGSPTMGDELAAPTRGTLPTVVDMQRLAETDQAVIAAFWVGETRSWLWVLRPGAPVRLHPVAAGEARLRRLVDRALTDDDGGALETLDSLLLSPVRAALRTTPHLIVVPHGSLTQLSFATLRDRRQRYLVERASVRYAPSFDVLQSIGTPRVDSGRTALVVGAALPGVDVRALRPLPGAARESRAVDALVRASGMRSVLLTGKDATEASVRSGLAAGPSVIHLAAHGVAPAGDPHGAYLALARGQGTAADDGRLTALDVHALDLRADLVVLSACGTARGPASADAVAGLSRAFLAAGARSVVATVRDLPDVVGPHLWRSFHRHRQRAPHDGAVALQRAQRDLLYALREGRVTVAAGGSRVALAEHPALWGSAILIGAR